MKKAEEVKMDLKRFKDAKKIHEKIVEREKFLKNLNAKYKATLTTKTIQRNGIIKYADLRIDKQSRLHGVINSVLSEEIAELKKELEQI